MREDAGSPSLESDYEPVSSAAAPAALSAEGGELPRAAKSRMEMRHRIRSIAVRPDEERPSNPPEGTVRKGGRLDKQRERHDRQEERPASQIKITMRSKGYSSNPTGMKYWNGIGVNEKPDMRAVAKVETAVGVIMDNLNKNLSESLVINDKVKITIDLINKAYEKVSVALGDKKAKTVAEKMQINKQIMTELVRVLGKYKTKKIEPEGVPAFIDEVAESVKEKVVGGVESGKK